MKAGPKLYSSEEDYTGLSALDPDDPHIIYVSTTVDPRDDKTTTPKHEIYEGVTCDNGATWNWAPLTQNSSVDNLLFYQDNTSLIFGDAKATIEGLVSALKGGGH